MKLPVELLPGRLAQFALVITCAFCIIIARLFYLQVSLNLTFTHLSERNFLRYEKIVPARGTIFDAHNNVLVTNRPVMSVYWKGSGSRTLSQEQLMFISFLEKTCACTIDLPAIVNAERLCKPLMIAQDISFDQLSQVSEHPLHHTYCAIVTSFQRYYPHGTLACHLLGYLGAGNSGPEGQMGLEKILEESLKGTPGQRQRMINAWGRYLSEQELAHAQPGEDIHTTLDLDLQRMAENAFPADGAGVCIVMSARDGALRALVSRPGFDPNLFLKPFSQEEWEALSDKQPFINRALVCYPPASLFKLISLAAAHEQHLISLDKTWFCPGYYEFCGRNYLCNKREGHGRMNIQDALSHSCNIPFFDMARTLKVDTLADFANRFGLGASTESILPEKNGLIPTSAWKQQTKHERWWPGETLSAVIGQSYLLVTPLQIARMVAAICEGFLVRPRIVATEAIETTPLIIAPGTRDFLKICMRKVSSEGSARSLKSRGNVIIHSKTGTAQISSLRKKEADARYQEHAWLVAHIQYDHHDPIVVVVLVERVGHSRFATAVVRQFLREYLAWCDRSH